MSVRRNYQWSEGAAGPVLAAMDTAANISWQAWALCAETDPEEFYPENGRSDRDAKKVCARCTVRRSCLDYALANDERFGVWGGLSENERRNLKRAAA